MLDKADLESILNRVHTWTHQVDEKVNVLLAAQVGLFAFLIGPIADWFESAHWSYKLSITAALSFQVWAIWHAGRALFPQTKNIEPHNSVTFFGDIANGTLDDYRKKLKALTQEAYEDEFVAQIHICSIIVTSKFTHFKKSIIGAAIGLGYLGLSYLVFRIKG